MPRLRVPVDAWTWRQRNDHTLLLEQWTRGTRSVKGLRCQAPHQQSAQRLPYTAYHSFVLMIHLLGLQPGDQCGRVDASSLRQLQQWRTRKGHRTGHHGRSCCESGTHTRTQSQTRADPHFEMSSLFIPENTGSQQKMPAVLPTLIRAFEGRGKRSSRHKGKYCS